MTDCWGTPLKLRNYLSNTYSLSEFDPCPFGYKRDGLTLDWLQESKGGVILVNPPYHKMKDWCEKIFNEYKRGCNIVLLAPANRTDYDYWHRYVLPIGRTEFIRKKLAYINLENPDAPANKARFPSVLVHFIHPFSSL